MEVDNKEYQTLIYYSDQDFINKIPDRPGNYFWVHYVNIPENCSLSDVRKFLSEYSKVDFNIPEEGGGAKFYYKIGEMGFAYKIGEMGLVQSNTIFSLSKGKEEVLLEHLTNPSYLNEFIQFFKELCFKRPFYIGKAIDLRSRIKDHIKGRGNSPIKKAIEEANVDKNHIWIGYQEISQIDETILNIYEEITQKKLKPGLTKKFG